jgi:GxxExxY protein
MNNTHHGDTETRSTSKLVEPSVTGQVIGAAIEVHRQLGPGLLESVYEECLCEELRERGTPFVRQPEVPVVYKGRAIASTLRVDLVVAGTAVIELKSVEQLLPVHEAQLLTYMKLTKKRVGLLINFNVVALRKGIVRRVL